MYPLLLLSIVSLAVIIERGIVFLRAGGGKDALLTGAVETGSLGRAAELAEEGSSPTAALFRLIFAERDLPKEELERKVSLSGSRILKSLTRNLHLLELIGKISPMLGLSGTILGLAQTFQKVASVGGAADPSTLADGIWAAMITTVTGLFIGIPAIIFFHLYNNRVNSVAFVMKNQAEELLLLMKEQESD